MDHVLHFVGRNADLALAIDDAQTAANTWLQEHALSIATVYSATNQSVWNAKAKDWYHVVMLTLQLYNTSSGGSSEEPPPNGA